MKQLNLWQIKFVQFTTFFSAKSPIPAKQYQSNSLLELAFNLLQYTNQDIFLTGKAIAQMNGGCGHHFGRIDESTESKSVKNVLGN